MYTCLFNEADNRLIDWSQYDNFPYPLLNPEDIEREYIYSISDFVYSEGYVTYNPPEETRKKREIARLSESLNDTDYIACKIAEGAATKDDYADLIAQRETWRARIRELENE